MSHSTPQPRWRDTPARGAEKLTGPLLTYAAEELIKRLLEDVGVDVERWKALLELLPVIPMPSAREAMVDALLSLSVSIVEESERSSLRATVQRVVS